MPLFEFICKKCNEKFETLVFGNENIECPKCKNEEIIKQFSSFASTSSSSSCTATDFCPSASKHKHKCSGGCCH
ncbi:MAG: zinc ribbon domain-containing protein [Endomicrobium sp.]|jgi:putative FmdB family regulatory protein|nr:zinc ribbon domain-containing protein [Endomicrobium sp.]